MKQICLIISLILSSSLFAQNFTEMIKAAASDRAEDDRFGYAVTIDGGWAAIGAYGDDFGGSNPNMGSVYIYQEQGLNNWVEVQKLVASDQDDYDRFGWSVDLDGDFLAVGAYGADEDTLDANSMSKAGAAYIFKNIAGTWTEMQILNASDRDADDEFGWSVAISDSTAIIGAHIEDHDAFGGDFKYHSGSVYAFELGTNNVWTETQKIVADDRWVDMNYPNGYSGEDLADQFGGSVAIWKDWMIVGAHHHDYATTSPLTGALWSSGAAYIFERSGGVWTQVQKIQNFDRESWDRFGYAVAIDSSMIAVCAYSEDEEEDGVSNPLTNPGSVYLFERDGGGTWNPLQKIVPDDRTSGDHFGYSIDIDDTLMVLGCHSDDHDEFGGDLKTDAGSAYIFEKNAGVWSQFQKIDASDRAEDDDFGVSVGISGHTVLVGGQYNDFNALGADSLDDAGAGYFFSNQQCPLLVTNQNPTICAGNSITVGTSTYTSSGIYSDLLLSVQGCDSTVNTDLTVLPPLVTNINPTICFGQSYTVGTDVYTTTGNYTTTLITTQGCDSIVNTDLIVEPENTTDVYATMCDGGTYIIFGVPTTVPGNYSYTTTAVNGCDSTIITHLTMDAPITSEQYVSICWGDSYSIGVNTYTASGTYEDIVSATNFCDSTITTHLTVELPLDMSITQNQSILTSNETGDSYQWFDCATGLPIAGATNQMYNATAIGSYGVIVTKDGCTDTSACLFVSSLIVNIDNYALEQSITLYPNPSNGAFTIQVEADLYQAAINIYDAAGAKVYSKSNIETSTVIDGLAPGVYVTEIVNGAAVGRKRIVIQ